MATGNINNLPDPVKRKLNQIPFDQFSRQYIAFVAVEANRQNGERLKILDVGGHGGVTKEFFPSDDVMVVDLYDINKPNYIKADALDLPFKDGEFDVVLSFDVLEHIQAKDREQFIKESARVSKNIMILAAPFYSQEAEFAERALNEFHQDLTGKPHKWLNEHIEYGLPGQGLVETAFSGIGLGFAKVNSNNLQNWLFSQFAVFLTANSRVSSRYLSKFYNFYNTHLLELNDYDSESYRKVYIAHKDPINDNFLSNFQNGTDWESQTKLYGLVFEHIQAMLRAAYMETTDKELKWYRETFSRADKERTELLEHIQALENELSYINSSRGWRIIKFLRKIRRKLTSRGSKNEK